MNRGMILAFCMAAMVAGNVAAATTAPSGSRSAVRNFECRSSDAGQPGYDNDWLRVVQERLCDKLEPAAKDMLGVSPLDLRYCVLLNGVGGNNTLMGEAFPSDVVQLSIRLGDAARPAAEEFADKAASMFPVVVQELEKESTDQARATIAEQNGHSENRKLVAESQRKQYDFQIGDIEAQLNGLGIIDSAPDDFHLLTQKLDEQCEMAKVDRAAATARRDALAAAVAKMTEQAKAKADDDEVAAELAKIVDARESHLKRYQNAPPATITPDELASAEADVAEARVRLLERREAVARSSGGDALVQLQTELQNVNIAAAETQARNDAIVKMSDSLVHVEEIFEQLKEIRQERAYVVDKLLAIENDPERVMAQPDLKVATHIIRALGGGDAAK